MGNKMNTRFQTEEFFIKAKELGFVADIDQRFEERKNGMRLEVIAKIKALPTREKTELPALEKAVVAARKTLDLAEEAVRTADRNFKELSQRAYGAQTLFDGARMKLEREAKELAPDFLRTAWEDTSFLDNLVRDAFKVDIETVIRYGNGRATVTTSNAESIVKCRNNINAAHERFTAMMFEDTARETALAEVATMITGLANEAYALGVSTAAFEDRRNPVDQVAKDEDRLARERKTQAAQREARRSQMTTLRP